MTESSGTGWLTFLAALGVMSGLMVEDIKALKDWSEMFTPAFFGSFLGHFGSVILAFLGGKVMPTNRSGAERTRSTDTN